MKKKLGEFLTSEVQQFILALLVWGVIGYLYATGQVVPEALLSAGSVILGFYFHTVTATSISKLGG